MKKLKLVTLSAFLLIGLGAMTACGNDSTAPTTDETSEEVTTGATQVTAESADDIVHGLSAQGAWIVNGSRDIDASGKDIYVDGVFLHRGEEARKLALYTQTREEVDGETKVTINSSYTLTVGRLFVNSPNFDISNMTVEGDVYVDAPGFHFSQAEGTDYPATINGNLVFQTQELYDAFHAQDKTAQGTVTGTISVISE